MRRYNNSDVFSIEIPGLRFSFYEVFSKPVFDIGKLLYTGPYLITSNGFYLPIQKKVASNIEADKKAFERNRDNYIPEIHMIIRKLMSS